MQTEAERNLRKLLKKRETRERDGERDRDREEQKITLT